MVRGMSPAKVLPHGCHISDGSRTWIPGTTRPIHPNEVGWAKSGGAGACTFTTHFVFARFPTFCVLIAAMVHGVLHLLSILAVLRNGVHLSRIISMFLFTTDVDKEDYITRWVRQHDSCHVCTTTDATTTATTTTSTTPPCGPCFFANVLFPQGGRLSIREP
jgi:hypothetical protein